MLLHETSKKISSKLFQEFGIETLFVVPLFFIIFLSFVWIYDFEAIKNTFIALIIFSPIWLPIYLLVAFWIAWIHYIREKFAFNQEYVLLEIEAPQEVKKSPLSMELFLTSLWNSGGETTFINRIWNGRFRPIWSLEIASNEGRLSFYLRTRKVFKNLVEARMYGQFPGIKIVEVEDYIEKINFNFNEFSLWGTEYKKGEPQALPIKTYINYEMDKDPDVPETTIDPLTNTLELMGTMGPGEYMVFQIVLKARKKDEWYGFYYDSHDHFKDPAKEEIQKITKEAIERAGEFISDDLEKKKVGARGKMLLSDAEKDKVAAIEKSLTKLVFECGIRVVYMAKKENFSGPTISALIRFFDAYRFPEYNSLGVTRGMQIFDYPWQDIFDIRRNRVAKIIFEQMKERSYFYVPYDQEPIFLTTEELATIWHFPSSSAGNQSLSRVASRKIEPPSNLPR